MESRRPESMRSVVGSLIGIVIVAVLVVVGLITSASRSNRREIGTLIVDFKGSAGIQLRIIRDGTSVADFPGNRDASHTGSILFFGEGLPEVGQEAWIYNIDAPRRGNSSCFLHLGVAGLPTDGGAGLAVPIKQEGDDSPTLPAAIVVFYCPDFESRFATSSERWKDHGLLILDGELKISGRDGDSLIGTLTAPLVMSSYLSL